MRNFSSLLIGMTTVAALIGSTGDLSAQAAASDAVKEATKADGLYAVLDTSMGVVVCKLHADKAPVTVANFIGLALGEKTWKDPKSGAERSDPFYDGLLFHRILKDFMVQGGCPLGTGTGNPGYKFVDEFHPDLRHDKPGVLSMANSGPNTNGSQFFITHVPTPWLDDKHSVFGQCILGQDVLNEMAGVKMVGPGPRPFKPETPIVLKKLTLVRTGAAAKAFDWKTEFAKAEEVAKKMEARKDALANEQKAKLAQQLDFDLSKVQKTQEGLEYVVTGAGKGDQPAKGQTISAHYTGYLLNGSKFDSSVDRGQPFQTPIGVGRVIRGWDIAFLDMKVGEKRVLIIPPELGYGAQGAGGAIPPNATLLFVVELLDIVK